MFFWIQLANFTSISLNLLKNTCLLFILFCFSAKVTAQCSLFSFFTTQYNCVNKKGIVSFTISGAIAPYTCTLVNMSTNNTTVAIGTTVNNTGTLNAIPLGSYTIYISSANSCTGSTQFNVNVSYSEANSVISSTNSCYATNNGLGYVNPPTSFSPAYTYSWSPGGASTQTASGLAPGIYSVTVGDSKGCEVTNTIQVGEFPQISSVINNTFIPCFGGSINSAITTTGGAGPIYHYTINNIPIASNTASNITVGLKTLITRDTYNCLATDTIRLFESPQHIIFPSIMQPSCPGKSDGSVSVVVSGTPAILSYTWQPGNSSTASLTSVAAGNVTLSIKDASACITKSVIVVLPASAIVAPTPLIRKENCSATDGGFTLTISGGTPPYTYTTLPINSTQSVVNSLSSDTYTTIIIDAKGCIDSLKFFVGNMSTVSLSHSILNVVKCYQNCTGSIQLQVQNGISPITYSASGTPTTSSAIISNLCAGLYSLKATDAIGCPAWDTVYFASPPVFTYSATTPPRVCYGKQVSLQGTASGGTGNLQFVWEPGSLFGPTVQATPNGTTVYSLTVHDANNCSLAPFQVTVNVNPLISIAIKPSNSGICPGSTAQITPTVSGGDGNYTYTWMPGNSNGTSIFVQNISIPVYTLIVDDGCGSPTAVKEINIKLFPVTKPAYIHAGDSGCVPYCTKFINRTAGAKNIIWNFGDGPNELIGESVSYCYKKAGLYTISITLTDSNSCKSSFTYAQAMKILGRPLSNFITDPEIITLNEAEQVLFKNTSSNASVYKWYAGSALLSEEKNFKQNFSDTGCFDFKLVSMNENHCIDSIQKTICVFEGFNFYMPAAFSPNHDGLNDELLPKGTGWLFDAYLFEVYNRWGIKVFKTNDVHTGWNGDFKYNDVDEGNSPADENDVYIWRVVLNDNLNKQHVFKGAATLLR